VFIFLRFVLKEGGIALLASVPGEQGRPQRNAKSRFSALAGGGAASNAVPRNLSWREIAAEQPEAPKAGG